MNEKKKVDKTRNKKRKNRMYTQKKYNMKKIYGGGVTYYLAKHALKKAKNGLNTNTEYHFNKTNNINGGNSIEQNTKKQWDLIKSSKNVQNTIASAKNIYKNLSGSQNENEKKIKKNESEIETLKKEKETVNDDRKNEINETILKLQEENKKMENLNKFDVSKGLQNIGKGLGNFTKGVFESKPKKEFDNKEKTLIIEKLQKMEEKKELTKDEFNYLINYLNQPQLPSYSSLMGNTQKLLQNVSSMIPKQPSNNETTIVAAMVPNYYDTYNKNSLPNEKDIKLSENIFLVNESDVVTSNYISSSLNGVDNFLAAILNECSGAGCKNGQLPKFKVENKITFTDNRNLLNPK